MHTATGRSQMRSLLSVIICSAVLVGCNAQENSGAAAEPDAAAPVGASRDSNGKYPAGKQYAWIGASKEAIKAQLKDAESAKFKDVRFYSGGGIPVTCGQVNAKNSFGGYGGFERFIAAGETMAVLESQSSDGIGPVWDKFCKHGPEDEAHTD